LTMRIDNDWQLFNGHSHHRFSNCYANWKK
jgi:hypothetical protein